MNSSRLGVAGLLLILWLSYLPIDDNLAESCDDRVGVVGD
jgi:hypothetical protein